MNFDYSDEQKILKDAARRFLAVHCTVERGVESLRPMQPKRRNPRVDVISNSIEHAWSHLLAGNK